MKNYLTNPEIKDISSQQIFTLERKIHKGEFSIASVGDHLPGNVLVTDLSRFTTVYMNKLGCNILNHDLEELEQLGPEYYQQFFVPDQINAVIQTYSGMMQKQDPSDIFNFVHQVKVRGGFYKWYFASAKLMYSPGQSFSDKMLLVVNEVNSTGYIAKKVNSVLDESDWMKKHFKKFCLLTKREKEIIRLLIEGKSSREIADILGISQLTVNTHRRNIIEKLGTNRFSELYKFATVFGLIA